MTDITVGPIQTYADDSVSSLPTLNGNSIQENVSVTLTSSNLWLVDKSKLNSQTVDPINQYALTIPENTYLATVAPVNTDFNAIDNAAPLISSESSYLQSPLPQGDGLTLVSVTGGTQFNSAGSSLGSLESSGQPTGIALDGTTGGLSSFAGDGSISGAGASSPPGSDGSSNGTAQAISLTSLPEVTPQPVPFENPSVLGLIIVLGFFSYERLLKRAV